MVRPWYERYFTTDYWVYAGAEYTAERTAAEVAYLSAVLTASTPGRRVLDIGCGIGRHAVGLAARGFDVVGVDVSAAALDRAAAAARAAGVAVELHRVDALGGGVWPVGSVHAAVCVQAFGWGTDADQLRMLRAVRRLLVPGGVLVLDHSNVSAILRGYAARSVAEVAGHRFEFERRYDPLTGRSGGLVRVLRPDGSRAELPDDVRLYQPPEVAALLTRAGFDVLRADADFSAGAPVGMDTRYVQFVARSPGRPVPALAGHRAAAPPGAVDLRWAPDEAAFVDDTVASAWRAVAQRHRPASGNAGLAGLARRYDVADPYVAGRCAPALAGHFGVDVRPEQVTAGAGATGLLHALAGLAAADTVLVEPCGHPELALAADELGAAVRVAGPLSASDVLRLRPAVTVLDRPGVDGRVPGAAEVRAVAAAAAEVGGVLVVDETCASYLPAVDSVLPLVAEVPGLVVLRSMSKGYCCGGLRVGFAVAAPDVADRVRAVCPPLAAGPLALEVALELLRRPAALDGLRERVAAVKPRFVELLAGAGIEVVAAHDPRLPWVLAGADAGARLAAAGVLAKAVPVTGGPGVVRVSVPLSDDRWAAAAAALAPVR